MTEPETSPEPVRPLSPRREALWRIIFLSDTPAGRGFDVALLIAIAASVLVVMLETVPDIARNHGDLLRGAEWFFTLLFTLELGARLWVCRRPLRYLGSFFGIVDLIAIVPTYLQLLVVGTQYLAVVRILRLLRMFRVFKMAHHIGEAGLLLNALRASKRKIFVFLLAVMTLVCIEGTLIYVVESRANPQFSSIPQSIYWAIVTITTVGYGDMAPVTVLGKVVASIIMLTGFAIIAVPTGVVTAELGRAMRVDNRRCGECGWKGHDPRASHCLQCGEAL
ncbi:MAG: ion transporter [Planctomycetes bacterium]|nr:ion transporter [Planctomycetota bacterium]MCB9909788.1 ion transporter [Planctomycetota bacterium]MCB9912303.1 ion transporter [Planctomycetota bacterium]HPF12742.1 ion transporter [Planctomycetota bacterium]HRV80758.1 ion transporter [Planctomycetota bacterium]